MLSMLLASSCRLFVIWIYINIKCFYRSKYYDNNKQNNYNDHNNTDTYTLTACIQVQHIRSCKTCCGCQCPGAKNQSINTFIRSHDNKIFLAAHGHDGKLQPHRMNILLYRVWDLACWW